MIPGYFSYLYKKTEKDYGKALYSLLKKNRNAKLLDCGCWDGINTKKYGEAVGTNLLFGIEVNKTKSKQASKRGIKVKTLDLNKKFTYKSNFFDIIIVNHVIEHLVNVRLFVSEIHRVLKRGGYVVIGTPNLASWHNVFALLIGLQPFSGPTIKMDYESDIECVKKMNKARFDKVFLGNKSKSLEHIKVMTTRALTGLLRDFNFKIENVEGFGYYPFPSIMAKPLSKADPYHSHYIAVKARK